MKFIRTIFKAKEPSIYQIIQKETRYGQFLDPNFSLDQGDPNEKIRYAAGAKDGIGLYHIDSQTQEQKVQELYELVTRLDINTVAKLHPELASFFDETSLLSVIDDLIALLRSNQNDVSWFDLYKVSSYLMTASSSIECVKLGMALMGLRKLRKKNFQRIMVLSQFEELSLFGIIALKRNPGGNSYIFNLAQKLHGWGKIHAVRNLEPLTQEIKDWILLDGCKNMIMPAYLGLICAEKGEMMKSLMSPKLSRELFQSIGEIYLAMFDEGPVAGISQYQDTKESLELYLDHAKEHRQTLKDYYVLMNIITYLKRNEEANTDLLTKASSLIDFDVINSLIRHAFEFEDNQQMWLANSLSLMLELDINEILIKAIRINPIQHAARLQKIFHDEKYIDEVIEIYDHYFEYYPLHSGMGTSFGFGPGFEDDNALGYLLQELKTSSKVIVSWILMGLDSPITRNRNGACNVLDQWQKLDLELNDSIIQKIEVLLNTELDPELRTRYQKILEENELQ